MFNIVLSSTCNLSCNYCFAEKYMDEDSLKSLPANRLMTDENFDLILEVFTRSKIKHASLLGGEPTLHPLFNSFAKRIVSKGMWVSVKTNAMWNRPPEVLFEGINKQSLHLHVNINGPDHLNPKEWEKVKKNLRSASEFINNINFQINISSVDFSYTEILKFAKEIGVKGVTWSPAVPIYNYNENDILRRSDYTKSLSHSLFQMFEAFSKEKISVLGVHGPTPCMFSKKQREWMSKNKIEINSLCFPVFDIFPDLSAHYCFPLKDFNKTINLRDYKTLKEVEYALQKDIQLLRPKMYPWEECVDCDFALNNLCQGGCLATSAKLQKTKNISLDILKDIPHKVYEDAMYTNKKFLRWGLAVDHFAYYSVYNKIYSKVIDLIDSKRSIKDIIYSFDNNDPELSEFILTILKNLLFERFITLRPRKSSSMEPCPFV